MLRHRTPHHPPAPAPSGYMATRIPVRGGDASPSAGGAAATPDCVGESGRREGNQITECSAPPSASPSGRSTWSSHGGRVTRGEGGHLDLQSGFSSSDANSSFWFPSPPPPPPFPIQLMGKLSLDRRTITGNCHSVWSASWVFLSCSPSLLPPESMASLGCFCESNIQLIKDA